MHYRDDNEALRARVRTLEAELQAERKARAADQARLIAAQAAADEARLGGVPAPSAPGGPFPFRLLIIATAISFACYSRIDLCHDR